MSDVQQYYDDMAEEYHFIFADWEKTVYRQADILAAMLEKLGEAAPKTVLDCTCGIGTQAIGLAMKGYAVHATDLSPQEIERAKDYATRFDLPQAPSFAVADLLEAPSHPAEYDIVLAFDNAISHFQTDADLAKALNTMRVQLKSGGLLTMSLRNYDILAQERPTEWFVTLTDDIENRRIVFQTWDWVEDGSSYRMEMFFMQRDGKHWRTNSYHTQLRAWQREDINRILAESGFEAIAWQMPDESGFYQPIVTARKIAD
jgi:glycine/sarcosine N-methyltransferase